jgi:hypothetical protein
MTHAYEWFSLPSSITVRCPKCGGPAVLHGQARNRVDPIQGKLTCTRCHLVRQDFVAVWPDQAFFICKVRGHVLWAWSSDHARAIRDFIQSKTRRPGNHRGFKAALMHLPKHFLLAKNRPAAVKALEKLLGTNAISETRMLSALRPPNLPFS